MAYLNIKINEIARDGTLPILQKSVSVADSFSFMTPSKSVKPTEIRDYSYSNSVVNEISKRVDADTLASLEAGSASRMTKEIQSQFQPNKLNLVIFNLTVDEIPEPPLLRTFAQHLYASSDKTILLPAVKAMLYKHLPPGKKTIMFSDTRFEKYMNMMRNLIEEIEAVGNNKAYIGMIPLTPIKFARQLIQMYQSKGMNCFAIDANTSDMLTHETDLRAILSEINQVTPLSNALIYACNLGYPRYERFTTRADDFLSLFAYVDIIGNTFKQRAFDKKRALGLKPQPRLKVFSRSDYSYQLLEQSKHTRAQINEANQSNQLKEAHHVRDLLGEEEMRRYLGTKSAVDQPIIKRLESIATDVKVS